VGKGRDKGVRIYALVRDRCVKAAAVSKVRFVGVACEIMPDELECDQPTFECEDCGHKVTRIFEQSVPQPTRRREAAAGQTKLLF